MESEATAELVRHMLLLPLINVAKRLEQWARVWLSLPLLSWLAYRNVAYRIGIHKQSVELVNLEAEQLARAELLKSLQDLGAGGDEGGGVFCSLVFCLIFLGSNSIS